MRRIWWLGLALLLATPATGSDIGGRARVADGDSLVVGSVRVRLRGIDAPEFDQRCGRPDGGDWACGVAATARLHALVDGRVVRCEPEGVDAYGRVVARCVADGVDLGARLVAEGLARAYARYSRDYLGGRGGCPHRAARGMAGAFGSAVDVSGARPLTAAGALRARWIHLS